MPQSLCNSVRDYSRTHMVLHRYGAHLFKDKVFALVAPHPNPRETHQLLACILRDSPFFCLNHTQRRLANHLESITAPGKHTSGRIIPSPSTHRDGPDHSSHDFLRAPHCPAPVWKYLLSTTYFNPSRTPLQILYLVPNGTTPPSIIAPTDLRRLYNTETYKSRATKANMSCIARYLHWQQFANQSDLIAPFMRRFCLDAYLGKLRSHLLSTVASTIKINPTAEVHPLVPARVYVTHTYTRKGQP